MCFESVEGEMAIGRAFGVKNNFSKMKVYPLAGEGFQGDLSGFEELGIEIDWSGNVLFMQVPTAGTVAFVKEWAAEKMKNISKVLVGLRELSSNRVALYLLKVLEMRVKFDIMQCPTDILPCYESVLVFCAAHIDRPQQTDQNRRHWDSIYTAHSARFARMHANCK